MQKTLPGQDVQFVMAPLKRVRTDLGSLRPEDYRLSAVMILFCLDEHDNWFLPLTERYSYNGAHSGQVSLPGGKFEPIDVITENTAIRECFEEIGVKEEIEIVGKLTKLFIPVSGFMVEPFVGICRRKNPLFSANEREVKTIIRLRITDLLNHSIVRTGTIDLPGVEKEMKIKTPYFAAGDYKIWGATAMILNELKTVIAPIF